MRKSKVLESSRNVGRFYCRMCLPHDCCIYILDCCLFNSLFSHFFSLSCVFFPVFNLQILLLLFLLYVLVLYNIHNRLLLSTVSMFPHTHTNTNWATVYVYDMPLYELYVRFACVCECICVCNRLDCTKCESKWQWNSVTSRSLVRIFHIWIYKNNNQKTWIQKYWITIGIQIQFRLTIC